MAAVLNNRSTHLLGWSDLTYPLVRKANWATVNFV
jgi:hypothetical protein